MQPICYLLLARIVGHRNHSASAIPWTLVKSKIGTLTVKRTRHPNHLPKLPKIRQYQVAATEEGRSLGLKVEFAVGVSW